MYKLLFGLTVFMLFMVIISFKGMAQNKVKGRVMDASNHQPIVGATVRLKNTNTGSVTDEEGNYSIEVPNLQSSILHVSSIGYSSQDIPINGKTTLEIFLSSGVSKLNELVVTGYTTQKKADLTGSVDIVNVDNVKRQPAGNVTNLLQGQASGVTVNTTGQPGESPQIRIRGINTFGNNTPLYVVDGVPTQDISTLNPDDVASIQVLKDAGAASVYGSRASNGVIILTTKKGKGEVKVHYDGYYGMQYPLSGNVYNKLKPMERAQLKWMALKNSGVTSINDELYGSGSEPVLPDYLSPAGAKEGDPSVDPSKYNLNPVFSPDQFSSFYQITKANKKGTDWYHEIFHPAPITNHDISVSGGGERGNYYLSVNYFNRQGILDYTFLRRYTIRANSEFNVTKNIHIGENLAYSIKTSRIMNSNSDHDNSIRNAATTPSIIPVHDIMGNFGGAHGTYLFGDNPVAYQYRTRNNKNIGNRIFGNLYANIKFLEYFTFHSSFGGDVESGYSRSFHYPAYETYLPPDHSSYNEGSNFRYSWTWTNTLTFHKNIKSIHDLKFLIGTETVDQQFENVGGTTQDYFSFDPDYTTLSTGSGTETNQSGRSSESLFSIFGQLNYSYKEKYLLSATLRRDGSSKFINNIYGWFPSVGAGWRISKEPFMGSLSWINDLKIRGSWGIMGNQLNVNPINGYYTYTSNKSSSYYDLYGTNNSVVSGFQIGQVGNPDATWEKDINSNIGIDATLLNGLFNLTVDYYYKNIKGLLYNPELIGTQGSSGTAPFINIARVKNNGVDLSLSSHVDITRALRFNATLSFTTYNNEILKVTDKTNYFWTNDKRRFGSDFIRNQVGHPIGAFYGYRIIGFWNSESEIKEADDAAQKETGDADAVYQDAAGLGRFRYADVNKDGRITSDDRTFIGNPNPDFSYGLNLGLNYKNFDFNVFFYGVQGNQIWNNLKWWLDFFPSFNTAKSKTALYDSWRPDHHNAKVAIQENVGYPSTNGEPNSYYIEDGSYFRAKNLLIGYTFSNNLIKGMGIQKLRVYIQAANLFTLTQYSGPDPELSGSAVDFGVDGGTGIYPHPRQFLIGINLDF